jgi:dipeptidyl aminopeptidase/acylaminoacyl peptidase
MFSPQLASNGTTLAYFVSSPDWKTNRLVFHMWRQPIGGAPQQLTFTEGGDIPLVRWSPDSKTLLFMRDGQLWLLPADGGEPRALTKHATSVSSPSWSPDGTIVYFLASDPRTAEERDRDRVRDDVYGFDETFKHRHVWKIVVSTGAETQLTSGETTINEYRLSPDGKRIAFERAPTPSDGDAFRGEVWTMEAGGGNARALTSNSIEERNVELSPDNSQVLFLADTNERFEPFYPTNLFTVPAAGGTPRPVVPDFRYTFDQATWAPDGRSIFATVNMGVHSELYQIDVAAHSARQLTDGQHYIAPGWTVVPPAERMVFQMDEPTRFGDVWTLPLRGAASPTRVTGLFDRLERDIALPRQEKVEWKGADGTTIEGVLFYPIGYEQGKRYPLVVQMHGGPMESDKFGGGPGLVLTYVPVLAAKGYAVLRPNYRGSVGYGTAFYRDVVNGYFHNMTSDILAGVDHLVQTGVVDPDKLIAMGWSAGGTLVNKLVTVTDRFKAGSAGAGVANWTSLWGQTDNTSFRRTWFGGTPWQKNAPIDAFWSNSPVKDASNVKTPTLLFAGESDIRVPPAQSIEMYRALKSQNVPTHLYIAPREGHTWGDLRHQIFKANAELEWFEKYAFGRTYTWEKPPQS